MAMRQEINAIQSQLSNLKKENVQLESSSRIQKTT